MAADVVAGAPNLDLSNAEEGGASASNSRVSPDRASDGSGSGTASPDTAGTRRARRSRSARASSLLGGRSRRFSLFLIVLSLYSLVEAGALNWGLVVWGFCGSLLFVGCVCLARIVHGYAIRSNARRRQRIPRGALEARLQMHHPGIELGRLRLLLVDRDFTGEDYQALLDLDENNEVPSTIGASEGEIRRNPSFVIREPAPDSVVKPKNCSICLYPFKTGERVRIIPCLHQFHTECIDPWLRQNAICPVCKFPALELETSTLMASTIDVEELIARPLDVIARLRAELKARDADADRGEENALLVETISDALGSSRALDKVPVLSRESLAEGKLAANSLVRYRGMVQDQYEPEYFVGSFEEVETATGQRSRVDVKYVDSIAQRPGYVNEYDGPGAKTMDRLPLYCVPVPGLSPWAIQPNHGREGEREGEPGANSAAATGGLTKRQREDAAWAAEEAGGERGDAMDCTDECGDAGNINGGPQPKALRPATNGVPGPPSAAAANGSSSSTSTNDMASPAFHHGQELELAGLACVVKLYDFREGQVKLNDTAEFVGVLGYDQASEARLQDQDGDVPMSGGEGVAGKQQASSSSKGGGSNPFQGLEDFSRKVPPPSLAPRLHCLFHRKVAPGAPLEVDADRPQDALHALRGPLALPLDAFMRDARRRAIEHLAGALGGDMLAAEYALLALLSRAYVRTESLAPGSLSLNLRGVSADQVPGFHAAVSDLVPKCVKVLITTKSLSEKFKFAPKKDYEADRLMLSSLQLSDGTVIVLDETRLEPGKVGAEGVGNLSALNSVASLQKVPYDFGFYKMDFEVDHPTISVSLRGSIVSTGAVVPVITADAEADGVASSAVSPVSLEEGEEGWMVLERLRVYVEATRRTELSLDEASSALAEEDFVKARQQGQAVTGEDFHRMLTIARLTALSLGDEAITAVHWNHMKDLEARVAGRVQLQKGRATNGSDSSNNSDGAGLAPAATAGGATPISPSSQVGPLNAIPENE
eukprot:g10109.t1